MRALLDLVRQPWPWWISGILIGAMVPLLLILANRHFGISSTLRHLCAACAPAKPSYFRYDWRKESWSLFLVAGIALGGWIASRWLAPHSTPALGARAGELFTAWKLTPVEDRMPRALFSLEALGSARGLVLMVVGGFLVGFGARWANGCTSGHAVMGTSLRSPASFVALVGFFAGGLVVSWVVLPWLFA